jgi:hypothetical protein
MIFSEGSMARRRLPNGPIVVGLDVHKKTIHVAILARSEIVKRVVVPADDRAVSKVLEKFRERVEAIFY